MTDITLPKSMGMRRDFAKRHPVIEDYRETFKAFIKNKLALVGMIITSIYFILTILDYVYPHYLGVSNPNSILYLVPGHTLTSELPTPPTFSHGWWYWLGTTESRIPLLPAMFEALKLDITYSLFIVFVGMVTGVILGAISGYMGGYVDEVLMRVTDIFFSLPSLILAIAIVFALGYTLFNLVLSLIIIWWPNYARLTRGVTLSLKNMKFVEAAVASGASKIRIIFKHVIPNVLSPALVQVALDLGSIVLIFAGLDFIGFDIISPYAPELGSLINIGQTYLVGGMWWPVTFPGLFLLIFTVSVNLLGDGLRDVLDPRLRR